MWSTSVQTQVPPDVLNRVTAYEVAGSVSSVAVGQALVGPVSSVADPPRPAAPVGGRHRGGVRGAATHFADPEAPPGLTVAVRTAPALAAGV